MIRNKGLFKINAYLNKVNAMGNSNFFQPVTNLKMWQREPCYSGIEVYNNLPLEIRKLSDIIEPFKKVSMIFLTFFLRCLNILVIKPTDFNYRNVF